ncbi:MAG: TrkA family potassium uptake protein [Actinobacteria bacterium]|nr:MAG: TrkA family potassium uptake protein [Actinomycetota bacterium]
MRIIVVGCGRVGSQLAALLAYEGHDVAIIDKNAEAFKRLGDTFNGLTIEGVGFDEDVLREAGVEEADVLAAVTDKDNTNLMVAEVATRIFSVPRVVARLYNPEREHTYRQLGLNYICGTTLIAQCLLKQIMEGHEHSLSVLRNVEIVEFIGGEAIDGKQVREVQALDEFRVAFITRDERDIIPLPETVLKAGDIVVAAIKGGGHKRMEKLREKPRL